jgi:hypothetical protein
MAGLKTLMPTADATIHFVKRWRLAAILSAPLLCAGLPALAGDAASLIGTWQGVGHQTPAGAHPEWTIVMTIGAVGGTIDYPSLRCGGKLTQLSRDAVSAQFHETITYGQSACIDGGTVAVKLTKGRLSWVWTGAADGTQYRASADITAELVRRESSVDSKQ